VSEVRVAIYGCGRWANRSHIPNLVRLPDAEIVALCDVNPEALRATAERFGIVPERTYLDGHEMLARESIDALFSVVRPEARTEQGVEVAAARRGIHLFSEKPQALTMGVARAIDAAIREGSVLSTVCFRERYRPLFQEARARLLRETLVHVRFESVGDLPPSIAPGAKGEAWFGGPALSWGQHAIDYIRYLTGLEVRQAQAFYLERPRYGTDLSQSFHLRLSNGATATMLFLRTLGGEAKAGVSLLNRTAFTFFYEGGALGVYRDGREAWAMEENGVEVKREVFDPWFEQDRRFIEAVRTGDESLLLNDYHDGLYTLAPFLAGWASARRVGVCVDVEEFMEEGTGELENWVSL
jgi:predicted dehydrogenase